MKTWRERIVEARAVGVFTKEDRARAGCSGPLASSGYATCAVGEQADRYGAALIFEKPRRRAGVKDDVLLALGAEFAGAVSVNYFDEAEALLDQIEDRAMVLKREATP